MTTDRPRNSGLGHGDRDGFVHFASETLLQARIAQVGAVSLPGQLSPVAVGTSAAQVGRALGRPRSSCRRQVSQSLLSSRDEAPGLRFVSFTLNHEVPRHEVAQRARRMSQ